MEYPDRLVVAGAEPQAAAWRPVVGDAPVALLDRRHTICSSAGFLGVQGLWAEDVDDDALREVDDRIATRLVVGSDEHDRVAVTELMAACLWWEVQAGQGL